MVKIVNHLSFENQHLTNHNGSLLGQQW